jgi:hypothetical protein
VLLIQIAAAALLLLGSWLIFRALLEIDASEQPRPLVRPRPRPLEPEANDFQLPRAA